MHDLDGGLDVLGRRYKCFLYLMNMIGQRNYNAAQSWGSDHFLLFDWVYTAQYVVLIGETA